MSRDKLYLTTTLPEKRRSLQEALGEGTTTATIINTAAATSSVATMIIIYINPATIASILTNTVPKKNLSPNLILAALLHGTPGFFVPVLQLLLLILFSCVLSEFLLVSCFLTDALNSEYWTVIVAAVMFVDLLDADAPGTD